MSVYRELKWLHIGNLDFPASWQEWSEKVEKEVGCKIHYEIRDKLVDGSSQFNGFDAIRIEGTWSCETFHLFSATPTLVSMIEAVDFIYRKDRGLWPHLIFRDGLHSVILVKHPTLNIKGAGLIIGSSKEAIQSAFVLVELGLSQITFVVGEENQGEQIKKLLEQHLFKVRIEYITRERVILLPGIYSVLICCEDLHSNQDLLTSILYFNYLEKKGLVINAGASLEKISLIEEAQAIGAMTVDVREIQFHKEIKALQKIIPITKQQMINLMK